MSSLERTLRPYSNRYALLRRCLIKAGEKPPCIHCAERNRERESRTSDGAGPDLTGGK